MIALRLVKPRDLQHVAAAMREQDRRECMAFGHDPLTALRLAVAGSVWSATAVHEGRPGAIMGLTPVDVVTGHGRPWMLCTDAAFRERRAWVSVAPKVVEAMRAEWPALSNYVAASNRDSIRWLRWLGFTVESETVEVGGVGFRRFSA